MEAVLPGLSQCYPRALHDSPVLCVWKIAARILPLQRSEGTSSTAESCGLVTNLVDLPLEQCRQSRSTAAVASKYLFSDVFHTVGFDPLVVDSSATFPQQVNMLAIFRKCVNNVPKQTSYAST